MPTLFKESLAWYQFCFILIILFVLGFFFSSNLIPLSYAQDTEQQTDTSSTTSYTDYTDSFSTYDSYSQSTIDFITDSVMSSINNDPGVDFSSPGSSGSAISDTGGTNNGVTTFTEIVETAISEQIGLGNEAGIDLGGSAGPGGPLSNINPTLDNGVVASYEAPDSPAGSLTVVGPAPVLSATTKPILKKK